MWVLVDGDRTQVVTTLGAREGVFVEVSEDRPWWAVKQERNAKGEIVTRSVELTEELRRIVENAQFDREWPEGEKRPVVRPVEQLSEPGVSVQKVAHPAHGWFGSTPYPGSDGSWERFRNAVVFEQKLSLNDLRALQDAAPVPLTLPAGDRLAGYQKIRDRVAASLEDPQPISKDAALALLDCAITAERTATYMEARRAEGARQNDAIAAGRARAEASELECLRAEVATVRAALADHETKLAQASGRNHIHSMDRAPPEDGVYVVWQKWIAETPLAGVAPTLRSFAGGRWSARGGSDAGWSFVPNGVL